MEIKILPRNNCFHITIKVNIPNVYDSEVIGLQVFTFLNKKKCGKYGSASPLFLFQTILLLKQNILGITLAKVCRIFYTFY